MKGIIPPIKRSTKDALSYKERTGKEWMDSSKVTNCSLCNDKFGIILRKHHCRLCGGVVCKKCSELNARLSENNIKDRVCKVCFEKVAAAREISVDNSDDDGEHPSQTENQNGANHLLTDMETYKLSEQENKIIVDDTQLLKNEDDSLDIVDTKITEKVVYGDKPSHYFILSTPIVRNSAYNNTDQEIKWQETDMLSPVAVILHGGYWKNKYNVHNSAIDSLSPFFLKQGIASCEVEYRRVIDTPNVENIDDDAGGYPLSNDDVLMALRKIHSKCASQFENKKIKSDALFMPSFLDISRIFLVGHSAGGYFALWSCSHLVIRQLPFTPMMCVALAPVCDLVQGQQRRISDDGDAVEKFMKMPLNKATEDMYKEADPNQQLPLVVPSLIAIGVNDVDVPVDMVEDYFWNAKKIAGESVVAMMDGVVVDPSSAAGWIVPPAIKFLKIPNSDHYTIVNALHDAWSKVYDEMVDVCPSLANVPHVVTADDIQKFRMEKEAASNNNRLKDRKLSNARSYSYETDKISVHDQTDMSSNHLSPMKDTNAPLPPPPVNTNILQNEDSTRNHSSAISQIIEEKSLANSASKSSAGSDQTQKSVPPPSLPELFSFPPLASNKKGNMKFF